MSGFDNCTSTGWAVHSNSFTWTIMNFKSLSENNLEGSQSIVRDTWKDDEQLASQWRFTMMRQTGGNNPYVEFDVKVTKNPKDYQKAHVQFHYEVISSNDINNGHRSHESALRSISSGLQAFGCIPTYPPSLANLIDADGTLKMKWTVKLFYVMDAITTLYSPENFQKMSKQKAASDLMDYCMRQVQPDSLGAVKIVAKDGLSLNFNSVMLSARSPVFEAMFRSDMKEGRTGTLALTDINSEPLKVLLHFIATGELLPKWNSKDTVVQLTCAAHKYQLLDLLEFLDQSLGECDDLEIAGELLETAHKLSLRVAEEKLLKFVRENGVNSCKDLESLMKGFSAAEVGYYDDLKGEKQRKEERTISE